MAEQITFPHEVDYIDLDGAVLILPGKLEVELLETRLDHACEMLEEAKAALSELGDAGGQTKAAQERVEEAERIQADCEQALADTRSFLERYRPYAKRWSFRMHRWGYVEREVAMEGARDPEDEMGRVIDYRFKVAILAKCIEEWSLGLPINEEEVGALNPDLIENLYARLHAESKASPARLSFRRIAGEGHTGGKPSKH